MGAVPFGGPHPALVVARPGRARGVVQRISETVTGAASAVAYQCVSDGLNATCDPSGTFATFNGGNSVNVVFTVTNTFAPTAAPTVVLPTANFTG